MKTIQEQNREVEYVLTKKELSLLLDRAGIYMTPEQWKASLPHYVNPKPGVFIPQPRRDAAAYAEGHEPFGRIKEKP